MLQLIRILLFKRKISSTIISKLTTLSLVRASSISTNNGSIDIIRNLIFVIIVIIKRTLFEELRLANFPLIIVGVSANLRQKNFFFLLHLIIIFFILIILLTKPSYTAVTTIRRRILFLVHKLAKVWRFLSSCCECIKNRICNLSSVSVYISDILRQDRGWYCLHSLTLSCLPFNERVLYNNFFSLRQCLRKCI